MCACTRPICCAAYPRTRIRTSGDPELRDLEHSAFCMIENPRGDRASIKSTCPEFRNPASRIGRCLALDYIRYLTKFKAPARGHQGNTTPLVSCTLRFPRLRRRLRDRKANHSIQKGGPCRDLSQTSMSLHRKVPFSESLLWGTLRRSEFPSSSQEGSYQNDGILPAFSTCCTAFVRSKFQDLWDLP